MIEFVRLFKARIAEGVGDGVALDDPQHSDRFGKRNQRGDQGGRDTLIFDRLRQRSPATRARSSGGAHDHRMHPVGHERASHLGAYPGHVT